MMEEQDILDDISGDHSGSNQMTSTTDDYSVHLPAYLSYLSLGFKVITTVIIVLLAGWVIITIKITRRLQKVHNIFVAHLMAVDAISALVSSLLSGAMMIGYFISVDFIDCGVFRFLLFPGVLIDFSFLMISVDKVIAITFPLRHHEIMKPRVVFGIIATKWVLAVMLFTHNLFNPNSFTKVAQFGTCISKDRMSLLNALMTYIVPVFLACLFTVILNIYLTIKAYQIRKKIQEESKLSGGHTRDNDKLKALKKKEASIKKHLKPMITLLVVVLGSTSIGLIFPLLFIPAVFLESPEVYEGVIRYVVVPNIGLIHILLHPLVYGLYFKQVRESMMRLLKGITCPCKCKSAAVAPLPQRRINWLNPN